jgi:hypothetical protein
MNVPDFGDFRESYSKKMILKNVLFRPAKCRNLALGMILCGCGNAFSAVYLSEVSNLVEDPYVELFNSSDSIVSLNGWSMECGLKRHALQGMLGADSVNVLKFEKPFIVGDSLVLRNEKSETMDKIIFKSLKGNGLEENTTFQRDTVVLFHDGKVLGEFSPFKPMAGTEGNIPALFEQDRSTLVYSFDRENNRLVGDYRSREIKKTSARFEQNPFGGEEDKAITVSPNPVRTILAVESTGMGDMNFNLQNIKGQILQSGMIENGSTQIDMSGYASGVYLLMIGEGKEQQTIKIEKR